MDEVQQMSTTAAIVVAIFGFLGLCVQSFWNYKTQKIVKGQAALAESTHREVAVNGGKNNPRTLNDKVGIVMEAVATLVSSSAEISAKQDRLSQDHAKLAASQKTLVEGQRLAGERQDQANARMDAHLTQSAQMDSRLVSLESRVQDDLRSSRQ